MYKSNSNKLHQTKFFYWDVIPLLLCVGTHIKSPEVPMSRDGQVGTCISVTRTVWEARRGPRVYLSGKNLRTGP